MSLTKIQTKLVATKNQFNKFGNYKYRSLEDITDALKPHLAEFSYSLIVSDTIEEVAGRVYVKATAKLYDENMKIVAENTAFAREPMTVKGMSESQITGAASSYARKYCLNGLFSIDDTKDADSMDNSNHIQTVTPAQIKMLNELIAEAAVSEKGFDLSAFLSYVNASSIETISAAEYPKAAQALRVKLGKAE